MLGIGHAREHVVQTVAELVKQRGHLVVRQERRRRADRRREVAHQLRHGQGRCPRGAIWRRRIRPSRRRCASRCASRGRGRTRRGLARRDPRDRSSARSDARRPRRAARAPLMPYSRSVTVNRPDEHFGQRKIGAQRLLRHLEAALLQPLAEVGQVPGLELATGELLELRRTRGAPPGGSAAPDRRGNRAPACCSSPCAWPARSRRSSQIPAAARARGAAAGSRQ